MVIALRAAGRAVRPHAGWVASSAAVEAVGVAFALLVAAAIGRQLGLAAYGAYAFSLEVASLAAVAAFPGLTSAVVVAEASGRTGFLPYALRRRAAFALPISIVVAALPATTLLDRVAPPWSAWLALAVASGLASVGILGTAVLVGRRALSRLLRIQVLAALATLAAVLLLPAGSSGTWIAATTLCATGLIQLVELCRLGALSLRRPGAAARAEGEPLRRYSRSMTAVGALSAVEARFDLLVVGGTSGLLAAGSFALAQRMSGLVKHGWVAANRVLLPLWSGQDAPAARRAAWRLALLPGGLAPLAGAGAFLVADPVGSAILGTPVDVRVVAALLVGAAVLGLPGALAETYFSSRTDGRAVLLLRAGPSVLYLAAAPVAVVLYGPVGLAALRAGRAALASAIGLAMLARAGRSGGPA